jgi:protein SCO1
MRLVRWTAAAALSLAAVLALAGCGAGLNPQGVGNARSIPDYYGVAAIPPKTPPPLALRDSLGHQVSLSQFQGKAVLVTFVYDHCPDICPFTVSNLHDAQAQLGTEAQQLQIIAVSVDPRGDTPKSVGVFLREHQMTGRMEYLLGSRPELEKVWRDWNILAKPSQEPGSPETIEHSQTIYGITASGKIAAFYSHDFRPDQIVHDVPLLASR